MKIMDGKKKRLDVICKNHKVETMYIFGSAVQGDLKKTSDIDLLVKFKKVDLAQYFDNYIALKHKLKNLFQREVDLVEEQSLRNPILIKSINRHKTLIYG